MYPDASFWRFFTPPIFRRLYAGFSPTARRLLADFPPAVIFLVNCTLTFRRLSADWFSTRRPLADFSPTLRRLFADFPPAHSPLDGFPPTTCRLPADRLPARRLFADFLSTFRRLLADSTPTSSIHARLSPTSRRVLADFPPVLPARATVTSVHVWQVARRRLFGRGTFVRSSLRGAFVPISPCRGGRSFGSALGCGRWYSSGCVLDVDQDVAAMERFARRLYADPGAHELHLVTLPLHLLQRRRADRSTPVAEMASGVYFLETGAGTGCWPGCGG